MLFSVWIDVGIVFGICIDTDTAFDIGTDIDLELVDLYLGVSSAVGRGGWHEWLAVRTFCFLTLGVLASPARRSI